MPKQRIHFPETLPGAAKFSGDPALNDPVRVVLAFKEAAGISALLISAGEALASRYGRPRMSGSWVLVAVGFVASRQGDIQPFYDRASTAFWQACGFLSPPSYSTTHARLTELEQLLPEIEEAIARMVLRYIELEPRIGRHVHIDGTEAETHSRFYHDCKDDEHCAWRRDGETSADVNDRIQGRAATDAAQRRRQQEDAGETEDRAEEELVESRPVKPSSGDRLAVDSDPTAAGSSGAPRKRAQYRIRTSNHSWLTHDPDAGFRSYRRPNGTLQGWHGYYHFRAVDDFTGLTLFGLVESSSQAEHSQYEKILGGIVSAMNTPELRVLLNDDDLTLTEALLGSDARLPEAIIGDRGFGYPFIYEQNTRLGIQTVTPWRKFSDGRDQPTEITLVGGDGVPFVVDRDFVIHCKCCGGPTKRTELRRAKGENPRIYVKCLLPSAPDSPCNALQSVPTELDWRMLTELPRTDNRYLALQSRFQFERAHQMGRARNRNGAKDPLLRPKRLGRDWQQLLLSVATLLDWFRAGLNNGWLESLGGEFKGYSAAVQKKIRAARQHLEKQVDERLKKLRLERQKAGLDCCLMTPPERPPPKLAE